MRQCAEHGFVERSRHGIVRTLVAFCLAAFACIKVVLSVGALHYLYSFFGFFDDKAFCGCFVRLHFWHIVQIKVR